MIKTNNLPGLFNDFINLGFDKVFTDDFGMPNVLNQAPVNITETAIGYQLEMVAPGRAKEDFAIALDKNVLSIGYQKKEEIKDQNKKQVRSEFKIESFKRSFTLNDLTDATKISAVYENGILYVSIPKKEIVKVEPTIIEIK